MFLARRRLSVGKEVTISNESYCVRSVLQWFGNHDTYIVSVCGDAAKTTYVLKMPAKGYADYELQRECKTLRFFGERGVPYVPRIVSYGQIDGVFSVVMTRGFPLPELNSVNAHAWQQRFQGALKRIHKAGYVHGDIKPSHCLRDGNNDPLLIDWGRCVRIGGQYNLGITPAFASRSAVQGFPAQPLDDFESLQKSFLHLTSERKTRKRRRNESKQCA